MNPYLSFGTRGLAICERKPCETRQQGYLQIGYELSIQPRLRQL